MYFLIQFTTVVNLFIFSISKYNISSKMSNALDIVDMAS